MKIRGVEQGLLNKDEAWNDQGEEEIVGALTKTVCEKAYGNPLSNKLISTIH